MLRRWCIPVAITALAAGSALATAGSAAASVRPARAAAHAPARPGGFRPGGVIKPAGGSAGAAARGRGSTAESTNWSGYAATGGSGAFSSVSATWTQPTATCTSGDKYASFWVGLDGYNSDSVEQTGTDSDCAGRTPQYYGWYEMYPAYPVNYSSTVRPGDQMSASVTFSGSQTYTLVLTDSTQGWTKKTVVNESGLARSSAEVITEAPSSNTGVLPLADFGTVSYGSSAVNGTSMAGHDPVQITMVDNSGRDKDSTSSINSGGGFSNTWLRSN